MENLRFFKEETDNDSEFSKLLASFADIYVNDAFGTSHRAHASTFGMATNFKSKLAGFLVDKELRFISKMLEKVEKPFVVIIGGSKIKDKISAMSKLLDKADKIIIAGGAAYTFIKANGGKIGNSIFESEMVDWANKVYAKYSSKIILPIDHLVSESIEKNKFMFNS